MYHLETIVLKWPKLQFEMGTPTLSQSSVGFIHLSQYRNGIYSFHTLDSHLTYVGHSDLTIQSQHTLVSTENPMILKHIRLHHLEVYALALLHLMRAILGTPTVNLPITLVHIWNITDVKDYN